MNFIDLTTLADRKDRARNKKKDIWSFIGVVLAGFVFYAILCAFFGMKLY